MAKQSIESADLIDGGQPIESDDRGRSQDRSLLGDALAVLYLRRWWLLAIVVATTIVFGAIAWAKPPVYRASTVLIAAGTDRTGGLANSVLGQFGGLASLAGINVGSGDSESEEALAVLRSREFTERFILENDLLPVLYWRRWDAERRQWRASEGGAPTPARAFHYFDTGVRTVLRDRKTGLITLQITWTDRVRAAEWANDLVKRLNAEMRRRAIARADAYVSYLEKELPGSSVIATRDAMSRLIEVQVRQRMLAQVSEDYAFRTVDAALAPDADDDVRLPKLIIALTGPLAGFTLGSAFLLFLHRARSWSRRSRPADR